MSDQAERQRLTHEEISLVRSGRMDGVPVGVVAVVESILAARLREQEDRVRQEFAKIGVWRVGQSALVSATGGDPGVVGSILSQIQRQVIDGYAEALRTTPPAGQHVEFGVDVPMPRHLDLDADPVARCTSCGRSTWDDGEVGRTCGLLQPTGATCEGVFAPEDGRA